ncbi:hypothetical protein OBBRIDRAFT_267717 [Obba rivulosa]|uniref:Uncharacterized protein n=1 Tax=Obba rivulosa TaxID=1052685 RepID=A0A8E2DQ98_9APHY|nr:hypothetical protein OBBRIDRAFT_267717 [Obba rivulosa]
MRNTYIELASTGRFRNALITHTRVAGSFCLLHFLHCIASITCCAADRFPSTSCTYIPLDLRDPANYEAYSIMLNWSGDVVISQRHPAFLTSMTASDTNISHLPLTFTA